MKLGKVSVLLAFVMLLAATAFAGAQDTAEASAVTVPAGPALTEGEIIILLQAKVPVEVIQKFVQTRGVGFAASKETGRKIITAGGNVGLVGTISLNQKEPTASASVQDDIRRKK